MGDRVKDQLAAQKQSCLVKRSISQPMKVEIETEQGDMQQYLHNLNYKNFIS